MTHRLPVHVYYEDTDLAGIVYYANYLKFIERARTEYVREMGVDQVRLREEEGLVFAVRRVEADYLAPAHFDEDLTVVTEPEAMTGARIVLRQQVWRADTLLFTATVTLVAMNEAGHAARLPAVLRRNLH